MQADRRAERRTERLLLVETCLFRLARAGIPHEDAVTPGSIGIVNRVFQDAERMASQDVHTYNKHTPTERALRYFRREYLPANPNTSNIQYALGLELHIRRVLEGLA